MVVAQIDRGPPGLERRVSALRADIAYSCNRFTALTERGRACYACELRIARPPLGKGLSYQSSNTERENMCSWPGLRLRAKPILLSPRCHCTTNSQVVKGALDLDNLALS